MWVPGGTGVAVEVKMSFSMVGYRREILRAMGVALVGFAGGCAEEGAVDEALPDDALAPPLTLTLPAHLAAGQTVQVVVNGATPNATVYLAASPTQGAGPCPAPLGGLCLDLVNPHVLGNVQAAANGRATFDVLLPHAIPEGLTVYLQAAQGGAAPAKTGASADVIEYPVRTCGDYPWLDANTYATASEVFACAPMPAGGVCPAPASITWQQWDWVWLYDTGVPAAQPWGGYSISGDCLEVTVEDACCYHSWISAFAVGRPFVIDGAPRLAQLCGDDGWCAEIEVDTSSLSKAGKKRLAWAWTRTARGEHASVAAFARLVLQLSHLGAPADLVAEATRALADEIRHARDAFAIASAFAGETVGAGPLDATGALGDLKPAEILRAAVREGCIAETIAAAQASVARDATSDPAIRAVLDVVAADEQRHAMLSWRFVRWMVGRDASLRAIVLDELRGGYTVPVIEPDAHAAELRAFGVLPETEMHGVARRVFDDVVLPCARAMLGGDEVGAVV